ncbi:hypothetical protein ACX80U_12165 [Arthrobacter sp. TmT3-37]
MRRSTPDAVSGTKRTITVQRCCNGCANPIGDADDADLNAAMAGLPLPDVRDECATCTPLTAALADPEGHALVQAILDRKTTP